MMKDKFHIIRKTLARALVKGMVVAAFVVSCRAAGAPVSTVWAEDMNAERTETKTPNFNLDNLIIEKDEGSLNKEYCFIVSPRVYIDCESDADSSDIVTLNYYAYEKNAAQDKEISKGRIECGIGSGNSAQIRVGFQHAGSYYIDICSEDGTLLDRLDYDIPLEEQTIALKEETVVINYGERLYLDDLLQQETAEYPGNFEITLETGGEVIRPVLYEHPYNMSSAVRQEQRDYIEATGVNGAGSGEATVRIQLKADPFQMASNVVTQKLIINKINTDLTVNTTDMVYMYERLPVEVSLKSGGESLTEQILEKDEKASINFYIRTADKEVKINSNELACEKGSTYQYFIPVNEENFPIFQPNQVYTICAVLDYEENAENGVYAPYSCNESTVNITLLGRSARLELSGLESGKYDYRTYFGTVKETNFSIDITDITDESTSGKAINSNEISKINYEIQKYDKNVINIGEGEYSPFHNLVPISIEGVGSANIIVSAVGSSAYSICSEEIEIIIENSALFDEDFVIRYTPNASEQTISYSFEEWQAVLEKNNNWINGSVTIALSDIGAQYYDMLVESRQVQNKSDTIVINSSAKQGYCFWAEHSKRNASTRKVENGTREFVVGIDVDAPVSKEFIIDESYFEPTKTETTQYYAQDFVLTGSFEDALSNIRKIEYTTNYDAPESADKWKETPIVKTLDSEAQFCIVLKDGNYSAIAVRAYDYAGNVSKPQFVKNENGAFIHIIVDSNVPSIDVYAAAGGNPYTGEGENWTNLGIIYQISCSNTEIYQYEYAYQKISDAIEADKTDDDAYDWKTLSTDKDGIGSFSVGVESPTDKNGYYYFQAISKSGVKLRTPMRERILLQQSAAPIKDMIQTGGDSGRKNEWYNKKSGVPIIEFEYPEYDSGVASREYDAPVTLYYRLFIEEANSKASIVQEGHAVIGVMDSGDYQDGRFVVTSDNLKNHIIDFEYDEATGYARDGIYTLEYWINDKAGNESEKQVFTYKIDTHEPEKLSVIVDGTDMEIDSADIILYERFYQNAVKGSASAEYGISGKNSIKIVKAKKIGQWSGGSVLEEGECFEISACKRCFIYVIAEDGAGNITEGWTRGIVVDNQIPAGKAIKELIVKPEGANEHDFYNKDIEIKIAVQDSPDNDDCAALMSVTESVGRDDADTITEMELFGFTKAFPTDEEITAASGFETIQVIDAAANESNNAYVRVTAVDRSGNSAVSTQILKIDVTKPEIEIYFDNDNAENAHYFNTDRTATIHVHELNFDPSAVEITVTRDGADYVNTLSDWESNGSEHYARLSFTEDGDYTLAVKCTDLADNESDEVQAEAFTIDKTQPEIAVELIGNDTNVINREYFNTKVTARITITEHNFNPEDFILKAPNNRKPGIWSHDGDVHTMRLIFEEDNRYILDFSYTDLAGNSINNFEPVEFVIDTKAPMLSISGVTDGSANSGEVIPVITISDPNFDAEDASIEVVTGRGNQVKVAQEVQTACNERDMTYSYTLSDMTDKEDDIYFLTVNAVDRAGNESTLKIRFSLNRRGSAYDLTGISGIIEKYYNTYEELEDMKIIEMNVDKVEDCNIYISRNGELIADAVLCDAEVKGSDTLGYTYTYTISRENFAVEGIYRLGIYSRDRAGNEGNNTLDGNGNDIQFVIDNTVPKVVIEGIESGMLYDVETQTVNVMVTDNFKLSEAEFILVNDEGEELKRWNYFELVENEGDVAVLAIPAYNQELSLLFRAKDAAGNEILTFQGSKAALSDFLVTTNKWVQLVKKPTKTPLGIGAICIIAAAVIIALYFAYVIYYKKHTCDKKRR